EDGVSQLIYYHPGVGSGNWFDRIVGGGFGAGLSANVESAYSFLVDNFQSSDPNLQDSDLIYLFGFSRGAFTARSLAGFLSLTGIVRKSDMGHFQTIYDIYRTRKDRDAILGPDSEKRKAALVALIPNDAVARDKLSKILDASRRPNIFFVGVWDTV